MGTNLKTLVYCESLNFTKTLKYISYKTKNDPAMLPHIIQCRSEAVHCQKKLVHNANTVAEKHLQHRISRGGGDQTW
jgi:hypothetical protein